MNPKFSNPSLTLYAFHVVSDVWQERRADADHLWQTLANLAEPFAFDKLRLLPNQIIDKQGQDTRFMDLLPNQIEEYQNLELYGNIYPVRIHDTYAVDFTVFFKDKILELSELSTLNPRGCLLPTAIQASFGQTLLFYAKPLDGVIPDKALAEHCLRALWNKPLPKCVVTAGQLFSNPLFEFEEVTDVDATLPTHALVWFDINLPTVDLPKKAVEINAFLMKLLCQRHKILSVSQLARKHYQEARYLYRQLEAHNQQFAQLPKHTRKRLETLTQLLKDTQVKTVEYSKYLGALNDHQTTLRANAENYRHSVNTILKSAWPEDKVPFWQDFCDESNKRRQQQIEIDLAYLTPAQASFQQLTTSIQSQTQIETLEHEFDKQEQLERVVVVIASTLESAAISAKLDYEHKIPHIFFEHVHRILGEDLTAILARLAIEIPFDEHLATILVHLFIGVPFGVFAFLLLWIYQRLRHS